MNETVVLVHGLWMTGIDMALLRRRIHRCGFDTIQFSYPTIRNSIAQNAVRLKRFVSKLDGEVIHFVGHSLGGLLVRQLLHDFPDQRPGRIVTLGTPHGGSLVAKNFNRSSIGRLVLGHSLDRGLLGDVPPWQGQREIGVIAGTLSIGVGWITPGLSKPNDGTVSVEEAHLPGMNDYIELPVSHTAMLFSAEVARQVCAFLTTGHFDKDSHRSQ